MATYFLRTKHISRGKGGVATRAAAYRAGERIRDERTSEVYDYSDRRDVAYKEVVLPSDMAERADMAWTQSRAALWNAMEHAGTRRNSRTGREMLVFLPSELTPRQRSDLARTFALELADKYRGAVDLTVHEPRVGADQRNHHAHLLMTTREVGPNGVGARIALEVRGKERYDRGFGDSRIEYLRIRERWAQLTNDALRDAGLSVRVDHRSLEQQGINREPVPTIPEKVFYAERKQGPTAAGDAIRARYRERVEARLKGPDELARVVERQNRELKERAREDFKRRDAQPKRIRWAALTRGERNERRRALYTARRAIERLDPVAEARRREILSRQARERYQKNPELARERTRQWRREHADQSNRNQREYRKANAEELKHKRREYRRAHAEEINRKQREWRKSRAEAAERAQREHTRGLQSPSKSTAPTALESAMRWRALRENAGPRPTAKQSAENWRALRENAGPRPTAKQSAENWRALRESQRVAGNSQSADMLKRPPGAEATLTSKPGVEKTTAASDGPLKPQPGPDLDLEQ